MTTCQSWRPKPHRRHPNPGVPGECRRCWTTCANEVSEGELRCAECLDLLLAHPNDDVRRSIMAEPNVSDDTLRRLVNDYNFSISLKADIALENRRLSRPPLSAAYIGGSATALQYSTKD